MSMNSQTLELFRLALLRVLEANNTRFGLALGAVSLHMGAYGFKAPGTADIGAELLYLHDKGMVEPTTKALSPENKCWRITAAGRDYLAENG
jgi:hypothetical protein